MTEIARIARYELPGKRWYMAVCERCEWVGMSWKDKDQAMTDRDHHNTQAHAGGERVMADRPRPKPPERPDPGVVDERWPWQKPHRPSDTIDEKRRWWRSDVHP